MALERNVDGKIAKVDILIQDLNTHILKLWI